MVTVTDYERWKSNQQQAGVGAANIVLGSMEEKPDQVAGDLNLASEFGKTTGNPVPPLPMVKEYRNIFQQKIEEQKNKTVLSKAPILTEWLRNPENAAVARDDLEGLSWWETTFKATGNAASRGVQRVPMSYEQFMANAATERFQDQSKSFGQILGDEKGERYADPVDLFMAGSRFLTSRLSSAIGGDQKNAAAYYQQQAGLISKRIGTIPMSPAADTFRKALGQSTAGAPFMQQLGKFANDVAENPGGALAFLVETAIESTPTLAAATAVTAATRSPAAGATFMGATSATQEMGMAPVEFFREKGIDVSTVEGAMAAISNPELMAEAQERGATRGLVIGLMDGLSGGIAGKALAASPIGNTLLQAITQAVMGAGGEAGAQYAAGQELNLSDVIIEGLAEFVTAPLEVAGVGGNAFLNGTRKARAADQRKAVFEALSGQSTASVLRNRLPEKFRQLVERATANGPVENIYVPAEQFVTYFQGIDIDPFTLIDEMEGVTRDDLEMAIAGGGDIQIPTATYAAKIAGSDHDAFFMENMRFDPDEFTATEAAEFNDKAQDAMAEAWEVAEGVRMEKEEYQSIEAEIYDGMVSRLRTAGRSTDVATNEAMLYPAFYRVMAERSGLTTQEFLAKYPLPEVAGSLPEGIQSRDVDALTRTLAEARNRKAVGLDKRQTLLEFISDYGGINDVGGELKSRDATVIKRGRGKKSLRLARGGVVNGMRDMLGTATGGKKHGADDVALAAIEAGFLADDPIANEYRAAMAEGREVPDISRGLWDAIDRELRGEAQYSSGDAAPDENAALDSIEEYLSSLGLSLDDTDEAIRQAIEGATAGAEYGQDMGSRPRGSIQFPGQGVGNGDTIIRLFETANLSTVVHESGHYFLTVLQDMASKGEANAQAEFAALQTWWRENAKDVARDGMNVMKDVTLTEADVLAALDAGTSGDVLKDAAIDVGMQEQFARAFEAYLMEGKAPSVELRSAFEKFRAWLISIYQKLAGLNVKVSDEVRGVFDRMLASDAEIAQAQQEAGDTGPVFATAEAMGLTPEDYAAFLKLRAQGEESAKAKLLGEIMAPVRREKERWFKDEREKVREETEKQINAYRHYRAIEWMGNRRWLGDGKPEDMPDFRLSKERLIYMYGAGVLETLPRGKFKLYAVEEGIDPDDAAGFFGFASGDEMIRAMETAVPRKEAIEAETDRIMRERHGDALNDGSLEASALDAVHNDKRGQWIAAELKAIVEIAETGKGLTAKEAKATARQTLSRTKVRDAMNANRFLAAERKAAGEAAKIGAQLAREKLWMAAAQRRVAVKARAAVRGDGTVEAVAPQIERASGSTEKYNETVARLIETKRRQLLNHALYMEARAITTEIEKAENLVAKLEKATKKIRSERKRFGEASISGDYVEAIEAIIYGYEFRKVSGKVIDRRAALAAYVQRMTDEGRANELAIPQSVLDDAKVTNYRMLTVEHLRGVVDSLKNVEHVARLKGQLLINKRKREFAAAVTDVAEAITENVKGKPLAWVKETTLASRAGDFVSGYIATIQSATAILRNLDGRKDLGVVYETLKADMDDAAYSERAMRKEATTEILDLYSVFTADEQRRMAVRRVIPELGGQSFSKWNMIAMALNMGNEGNLSRLTNTKALTHLTPTQAEALKSLLDKREWDFVQSVWDYINSYRSKIAERDRRVRGVEPTWVDAVPVETPHGTYRGGYYPIKYEGRLGGARFAAAGSDADILSSMMSGGYASAQTKNGHLKSRGEHIQQSLTLDVGVIAQHVNEVVHDLAFSEPVVNTWRILTSTEVERAMIGAGLDEQHKMLKLWVQDAASGQVAAGGNLARSVGLLRSGFVYSKLALNVKTMLLQPLGLMQSAVVVGKKNMTIQMLNYVRNPIAMSNDVLARSRVMWERQQTFNKDLMDAQEQSNMASAARGKVRSFIDNYAIPFGMAGITYTQFYIVDVPTWAAAFRKGMKQFDGDETKSVQYADMTIQRSQSSGIWSERSGIERGTLSTTIRQNPFVLLLTTLGSYFFAKMNLIIERTQGARAAPFTIGNAMSYALDMTLLLAGEAAVLALLSELTDDDDDDDDDDASIAGTIAIEAGKTFLAGLPGIRDITGLAQGFQAGTYASIMQTVWEPIAQAGEGDLDKKLVKSTVNLSGMLLRLPSSQVNRIIDGAWREFEGEDVSPVEYMIGRR